MNTRDTLESKLVRLASAGVGARTGRVLSGPDTNAVLTAVLREIDELLLPRSLFLVGVDGRTLTCDVTNRRLLSVRSLKGPDDPPFLPETLEGATLDPVDTDRLTVLRQEISALIGSGGPVTVAVAPMTRVAGPAEIGVSARRLADDWDLTLDFEANADGADPIAHFLALSRNGLIAVHLAHEPLRDDGTTDSASQRLRAIWEKSGWIVAGADSVVPVDEPFAFAALQEEADGGVCLLLFRYRNKGGAALARGDMVAELAANWRHCVLG